MLEWLILHTLVTAALAAVVWLVVRRFRLSPAARHALWLVVLLKLLTPPLVRWPWSLPVLPRPAAAAPAVAEPTDPAPAPVAPKVEPPTVVDEVPAPADAAVLPPVVETPAATNPHEPLTDQPKTPAAEPPTPAVEEPAASPGDWLRAAAVWAWVGGGGVVALVQLVRVARLQRRLAGGRPPPGWLVALVGETAERLGLRPPRVVVLPGVASPMVWGLGAPRLLWPQGLESRLPAEGRRAVVLHELAHLRRRDHWVGWLLLAGGCVWWWHPLFAWVRRRLACEAELACDAWVVAALPQSRRAYAEALIEVSRRPSVAAAPALGAAAGRRDLERRLVMIMRGNGARRMSWLAGLAAGVLGLLALPAWSLGGGEPAAPPPPAGSTITLPTTPAAQPPASVTTAPPGSYYEPVTTYRAVTTYQPVTSYQLRSTGEGPAAAPPASDRDKKIQDLEAKIKQLLKELEELRGDKGETAPPTIDRVPLTRADVLYRAFAAEKSAPAPAGGAPGEITLSRVTYKLPAGKAEAVATFLKEQVKTSVLETKADGDNLVVTTTPEAQHVIGQFIALIQGKTPATGRYGYTFPLKPEPEGGAQESVPPAPVPPTSEVPAVKPPPALAPVVPEAPGAKPPVPTTPVAPAAEPPAGGSLTPPPTPAAPLPPAPVGGSTPPVAPSALPPAAGPVGH
jgi:beta-lactamase regulating signal transducer with metallopeptidase domain